MSEKPHPLTGNRFAAKPPEEHITGKGRITVDLGVPLHGRLVSYAKHEKRKIKDVVKGAIENELDKEEEL